MDSKYVSGRRVYLLRLLLSGHRSGLRNLEWRVFWCVDPLYALDEDPEVSLLEPAYGTGRESGSVTKASLPPAAPLSVSPSGAEVCHYHPKSL